MKQPPFAAQMRARPEIPLREVLLYAGFRAWDQAKAVQKHRAALVYPYDRALAPKEYDWSCVWNCEVTILHSGGVPESVLDDLARVFVQSGARIARVISPSAENHTRRFIPQVAAHG